MKLASLITDSSKEKQGVWKQYDGGNFLIAASMNPAHQRAMQRHSRTVSPGKLRNDAATQERVTVEAMADAILLDWNGEVLGLDEKPLAVTRENKIMLLNIRAFREWVATECQDIQNFQAEAQAEDAKDLKSGSAVAAPMA